MQHAVAEADLRLVDLVQRGMTAGSTTQNSADPRQQLARIARLGQIVVGTDFQTDDAIHIVASCRENQNRRLIAGRAQIATGRQSIAIRQHQVQHDQST
jgi:hypothetical protein